MNDLNAVETLDSGWHNLEFWMTSVHYWTNQLNAYGDQDGFYARSIDQAWAHVDYYLFG
jgi:hypothetical protein